MFSEDDPTVLPNVTVASPSPADPAGTEANSSEASEGSNLFDSMDTLAPVQQGQIVQGRVLKITESEVLIDVGVKSEASLPRNEFLTDDGQLKIAPDDVVDVLVEHYDETTGTIIVSHQKASRLIVWETIERAFKDQTTLQGRVVERIKGGLTVDIGVRAFLPGSHADVRPHSNLDALLGQEIACKVIKFNRKRNNVVVSRKMALEEELARRKAELTSLLVEGAELIGQVKNLTDYGVFVDLGGMDGLLHITDLSWGRVGHPSEVVQVGQEIRVKVLKYDREKERVSLGMKQLLPDPWERVTLSYHPGDRVVGRVVSLTDYGAFVELEPGIEGLIHISEMTWGNRLKHPSKIVSLGDRVEAVVLDISPAQRRISLSLRRALPDPWQDLPARITVASTVQGQVRHLTEFGAFVEIEEGVEGLIHVSNLSWSKNVKHPSEVLKKGQKIEAVVLSLEPATRRLSLGLKQLQPDIWKDFFSKIRVDDVVRGKVSRVAPFGVFVELAEGIEGLCHNSELGEDHGGRGSAKPELGAELDFRVIRLNPAEKKIGLSLREVTRSSASGAPEKQAEPEKPSTMMAEALSSAGIKASAQASSTAAAEVGRGPEVYKGNSRS